MTSWTKSFPPGPPMQSYWASTCWTLPMNLVQRHHMVRGAATETDTVALNESVFVYCRAGTALALLRAVKLVTEARLLNPEEEIPFKKRNPVLSTCMIMLVGSTLITVGEYQKRLGTAERELLHTSAATFLTPLRNFLEGDWRTISVSPLYSLLSY